MENNLDRAQGESLKIHKLIEEQYGWRRKEMIPKISVVVPVYNAEEYLGQCLDSICAQTLYDIEIICVDDGSTDQSAKILDAYAKMDGRIQVMHQKNMYAGAARNRGMKIAKGKYLSFLDSDDYFDPDMLEVMFKKAEETNADIVICNGKAYSEEQGEYFFSGAELDMALLPEHKKVFSSKDISDYIFQISKNFAWNKLFNREFIECKNISFQRIRIGNDGYFVNLAMAEAHRIAYTTRYLVTYRREHPGSLTQMRDECTECFFQMFLSLQEAFLERGLYKKFEKSLINRMLTLLIGSLLSMENAHRMEEAFWKLKRKIFSDLHVIDKPESYFYDEYFLGQYKQIMSLDFKEYLFEQRQEALKRVEKLRDKKTWFFPLKNLPADSKVIIYGAGNLGQNLYQQFTMAGRCEVVKWVDQNYKKYCNRGLPVCDVAQIADVPFDYIIIAVLKSKVAGDIRSFLTGQGIAEEKIIWENLEDHDMAYFRR